MAETTRAVRVLGQGGPVKADSVQAREPIDVVIGWERPMLRAALYVFALIALNGSFRAEGVGHYRFATMIGVIAVAGLAASVRR